MPMMNTKMVKIIYKCFICGVSLFVWTWDIYKVLPAEWGLVENLSKDIYASLYLETEANL